MITTAHRVYAGPGVHAPTMASRSGLRREPAHAHSFALPRHWSSDPFTVLILPVAIAVIGVFGAILCCLVQWD